MLQRRDLYRFIIKGALLFLVWELLYQFWLGPYTRFDAGFIYLQTLASAWLLDLFGYDVYTAAINGMGLDCLWIGNSAHSLNVQRNCNAIELVALFTIFLIAFPSGKNKKWWIVPGVLTIFFFNILRISALVLIEYKAPEYLNFNHIYTFTALMYIVILLMWYFWIRSVNK